MRLTDDTRGRILRAVLIGKLQEEYDGLCIVGAALAHEVYLELIPRSIRELPEGICKKNSGFQVKFGESYRELNFNGAFEIRDSESHILYDWFKIPEKIFQPFPYNKANGCIHQFEPRTVIYKKADQLLNLRKDFITKFLQLRLEIQGVVSRFTTIEKLLEAWPEVRPFIPPAKAPVQLPALPIDELNKKLKLP